MKKMIKSKFFPLYFKNKINYKYSVFVGIGGNIGDVRARFEHFFMKIKRDKRFFVKETSQILKNKAFGYLEQPDFLNAVMLLETSLHANKILTIMQHYEKIFQRKRSFKNAPRTLDLDLLYFSSKTFRSSRLILPHPYAKERLSVIIPLGTMKEAI